MLNDTNDMIGRIGSSTDIPVHIREVMRMLPKDTLAHMRQVSIFVNALSIQMMDKGLYAKSLGNKAEYRRFGQASFYHDIGKIGVPTYLLTKVGPLTKEELGALREHPIIGNYMFSMMKAGQLYGMVPHLFHLAEQAALSHHEHWDGNGYPYGIRGNEIPLIARVTAVCDAYDAMTTNRQYDITRTHEEACRELLRCANSQFDPLLVKLFLQNHETFDKLKRVR